MQVVSDQQPQCIYELIVRSFATFKFPKGSDAVDIKKFLLRDYTKQRFRNTGITNELHAAVHNMLIGKIGAELDEGFVLNLLKIKSDTLESYASTEALVYPLKNSTARQNCSTVTPFSTNILCEKLSEQTIFVRGNDLFKIKELSEEDNDLNRIKLAFVFSLLLQTKRSSELINRFSTYHTIPSGAVNIIKACERAERTIKSVDQWRFVVAVTKTYLDFLYNTPLLLSDSTFQAFLVHLFNQVFDCSEVPSSKAFVSAFFWNICASRGIDISFFMNALGLGPGLCIYDLCEFPDLTQNVFLDAYIAQNMDKPSYRDFAYSF